MKRLALVLCGGVLAAAILSGCASQTITERHLSGIPDNSVYRDKPVIMIFPILLPFSLGFK